MLGHKPLTLLILVILLQVACERMETAENAYATFADALKAEAVGDGKWIPGLVPPSAREIREAHNLDTNEVWLAFRLDSTELPVIAERCTRITEDRLARARKRPAKWWPEDLVRGAEKAQPGTPYQHYECGTKSFLSIDTASNKAYYWVLS
jgi:hypothetical protein